jgi:hypothetical protein
MAGWSVASDDPISIIRNAFVVARNLPFIQLPPKRQSRGQ